MMLSIQVLTALGVLTGPGAAVVLLVGEEKRSGRGLVTDDKMVGHSAREVLNKRRSATLRSVKFEVKSTTLCHVD